MDIDSYLFFIRPWRPPLIVGFQAGLFLARNDSSHDGRLWKEISQDVYRDSDRLFKLIGEAYAVLSDPSKVCNFRPKT